MSSRTVSSGESRDETFDTIFKRCLTAGDRGALVDYLLLRSNLPGPRANLELVHRFAGAVTKGGAERGDQLLKLCTTFIDGTPPAASVGNPMEFIPLCGVVGLGSLASLPHDGRFPFYRAAMERLRRQAADPRWRVREGVAMALQRVIPSRPRVCLRSLEGWIAPGEWYTMRAVAAGVAEPALLADDYIAVRSLDLHRRILNEVREALTEPPSNGGPVQSESFRKLLQCLEYSLSVVVAAMPEEGFAYLDELAGTIPPNGGRYSAGAVLQRLLKENLKKSRLKRFYAKDVASVMSALQ